MDYPLTFKSGPDTVHVRRDEYGITFKSVGPRGGMYFFSVPSAAIPELLELAQPDALGDHKTSAELEPEAGYILLDATDGEGEELARYLDRLPNATVQRIMCANIDDINGAIVKRDEPDGPALEIWATTAADPSSGYAEFCRVL